MYGGLFYLICLEDLTIYDVNNIIAPLALLPVKSDNSNSISGSLNVYFITGFSDGVPLSRLSSILTNQPWQHRRYKSSLHKSTSAECKSLVVWGTNLTTQVGTVYLALPLLFAFVILVPGVLLGFDAIIGDFSLSAIFPFFSFSRREIPGSRNYSFYVRNYSSNSLVVPVKIYANADIQKSQILTENKGKSGVYRGVNLKNGQSYIGSSVTLPKRLGKYSTISFLESTTKKARSIICSALLKNGYSGFSLEILEYCEPSEVIAREQYYLERLNPEYNILKNAGSPLGRKHSEETKAKMSAANQGRTHTEETITKIWTVERKAQHLEHLKKYNSSSEHQERLLKYSQSKALRIEVLDILTNQITVYPSMSEAGSSIGCSKVAVHLAIKNLKEKGVTRLIKKRYSGKPIDDKS